MPDETLFSWIHVSDIHIGHGDAAAIYDQKLVLEELKNDLPKVFSLGAPKPDVILVTGDVAFSGNARSKTEYSQAETWLADLGKRAGLEDPTLRDRIFVVPGNHDVDRGVDKKFSVGPLVTALRRNPRERTAEDPDLDTVLADEEGRQLIARRMSAYLGFAKGFGGGRRHADEPEERRVYWTHTSMARGGLSVRLVGLNTALLARGDDEGRLRLGKEQIQRTLPGAPAPGELVVVLTHHPFDGWLADGTEAQRWIESRAHLHLSGHVHAAGTRQVSRGHGADFVEVVAGAAHSDPHEPPVHGYNLAAVIRGEDRKLRLRVWPRRWSSTAMEFRVDRDSVLEPSLHAEHPLRLVLP